MAKKKKSWFSNLVDDTTNIVSSIAKSVVDDAVLSIQEMKDGVETTGKYAKKFGKTITGIQAYEDKKKAEETKKRADYIVESITNKTEELRAEASKTVEEFARIRCQAVQSTIGDFIKKMKYMEQRVKDKEYVIYNSVELRSEDICRMESIEMNASTALGTAGLATGIAGVALAGVPTAVTSAVAAVATASTGTAISSLSGAAATNATLAWLGGGSIAAGGGGMAAGATVLAGITYASAGVFALASAGVVASTYYSKKYTEATKYLQEVRVWESKMKASWEIMRGIMKRCDELKEVTLQLQQRAMSQLELLEPLVYDFDSEDDYQIGVFQNSAILVKGMSELAQTPVMDNQGNVSHDSSVILGKVQRLLNNKL